MSASCSHTKLKIEQNANAPSSDPAYPMLYVIECLRCGVHFATHGARTMGFAEFQDRIDGFLGWVDAVTRDRPDAEEPPA